MLCVRRSIVETRLRLHRQREAQTPTMDKLWPTNLQTASLISLKPLYWSQTADDQCNMLKWSPRAPVCIHPFSNHGHNWRSRGHVTLTSSIISANKLKRSVWSNKSNHKALRTRPLARERFVARPAHGCNDLYNCCITTAVNIWTESVTELTVLVPLNKLKHRSHGECSYTCMCSIFHVLTNISEFIQIQDIPANRTARSRRKCMDSYMHDFL